VWDQALRVSLSTVARVRQVMRQQESLSSGKRARRLARRWEGWVDSDSDGLRVVTKLAVASLAAMLNFQASRSRAAAPQRRFGVLLWRGLVLAMSTNLTQLAHAAAPLQYHCNPQRPLHSGRVRCDSVHIRFCIRFLPRLFCLGPAFHNACRACRT
jgi:hypothetical protein